MCVQRSGFSGNDRRDSGVAWRELGKYAGNMVMTWRADMNLLQGLHGTFPRQLFHCLVLIRLSFAVGAKSYSLAHPSSGKKPQNTYRTPCHLLLGHHHPHVALLIMALGATLLHAVCAQACHRKSVKAHRPTACCARIYL